MKTPIASPLYYIGLMSGTSLDGIDAALIAIENGSPPRLLATHAEPMPDELHRLLLTLCHAEQVSFAQLAAAEHAFCQCQAQAVQHLLAPLSVGIEQISAIGSHGQTIEHAPAGHNGGPAYTLQLDNPSLLAEITGCTVVADFRRRDLAAGGQAAPLAPAFHQALFGRANAHQLVLNLGGFANLTWLSSQPTDPVIGFDTGPANVLLDGWFALHQGGRFDRNGDWAASGEVDRSCWLDCYPNLFSSSRRQEVRDESYFIWIGYKNISAVRKPPPTCRRRWLNLRRSVSRRGLNN